MKIGKKGVTMGCIPIRQREDTCNGNHDLPLFYMNDFSIMGLVVDRLSEAISLITAGGHKILEAPKGSKIVIERPAQLQEIFQILKQNRIEFRMSDMVAQVYQG